jgi:FkbM family methyltransferase
MNMLDFIKSGSLVFDVGANIGLKTREYLDRGARVVCIEPQEECCNALVNTFGSGVTIERAGLSDKIDQQELSICDEANTISTFSEAFKHGRFGNCNFQWLRRESVAMTTLDCLIDKYGKPDFIKIDVEGYEHPVLCGLSQNVPLLSFEFHAEFMQEARKCIDRLGQLDFTRFTFCDGDTSIAASRWALGKTVLKSISSLSDEYAWGDVYARGRQ